MREAFPGQVSVAWPTSGAPVVGFNRLAGPLMGGKDNEPVSSISHGFLNPYNNLRADLDLLGSAVRPPGSAS